MNDGSVQQLKTGTTTVGILCKDAVVLGSESKSTMGWLVANKEVQKVFQIDDKLALTIAGSVGDALTLIRVIKAEIQLYKLMRNTEISTKAAITLMANIMQGNRYYPYMTMLLLGGYDKTGHHLYSIDPIGGIEEEKFTSTGSGSPVAYGVLEDGYKEGMTKEEGIKLAVRSIRSARERDVMSGGKLIWIVTIDKDGVKFIDRTKIDELVK